MTPTGAASTSGLSADLGGVVDGWRTRLKALVEAEGADLQQGACFQLSWAVARAQAAAAVSDWARKSSSPVAEHCARALLAEAALATAAAGATLGTAGPENAGSLSHATAAWLGPEALTAITDLLVAGDSDVWSDSAEERLIRESVRAFALREVAPTAQQGHRDDSDLPESLIKGVSDLGLLANSIPPAYGGTAPDEPDFRPVLISTEELARVSLAAGSLATRPEILVAALLAGGTEAQKQRWLPQIAAGARLVAVAVTEPDHGSDVAGIQCRAQQTEDGSWSISGTKLWCTFAGRAELLLVLCRTTPGAGHRGETLFVIEKPAFSGREFHHAQPGGGSLRGRAIPTIGYRGMHTFELAFDEYRVPGSALLGGPAGLNQGFYLQMKGFAMGRLQTAARGVGLMQAAVDLGLSYAQERTVFGRALVSWQLARASLGLMVAHLVGARQLAYRAAAATPADLPLAAALAKLYASRMAEVVTRDAMQLYGALGYAEESEISRHFLDARVLTIFEGTEEVLALRVIAPALLA